MSSSINDFGVVTKGEVKGSGHFDELMRTVKAHLDAEHTSGKITDQNYATVYLGSLQSSLSAAMQFAMQAPLNAKQEEILSLELLGKATQNQILTKQLEKLETDILISAQQLILTKAKVETETKQQAIMTQQALKITAEIAMIGQQTANAVTQNDTIVAQTDLTKQQMSSEQAKVSDTLSVTVKSTGAVAGLMKRQFDKADAEQELLTQKKATETAQTVDPVVDQGFIESDVDSPLYGVAKSGGVVGSQIAMYRKQTAGFQRDAEQKVAKMHGDFFNLFVSSNLIGEGDGALYGVNSTNISNVLKKVKEGINITTHATSGNTSVAAGDAQQTAGAITVITITSPGYAYSTPPIITITGTGSGATAIATISETGTVDSVTVTAGGSNYDDTTVVTFSAP